MFNWRKKKPLPDTWDKENIKKIDVSKKSYHDAVQTAQEHIEDFIAMFEGKELTLFSCFIKVKFEDESNIEHMWLEPTSYANNIFTATVENEPNNLKTIKYKDVVKVKKQDVEDWIVSLDNGIMFGNFINDATQPQP
jgi:uncharacterized protein YegJ (DUF2314 family)